MPGLFILFIALAVRSLTLPGAMEGVAFLLKPDWSYLKPGTMLTALGQAFFCIEYRRVCDDYLCFVFG